MPPHNAARLWRPTGHAGLTCFKASFTTFVFDKHVHEDYALGVIETGAQELFHKGATTAAPPGAIISVNPDEVHGGQALTHAGYTYRMLYVDIALLREMLPQCLHPSLTHAFPSPITWDPPLARALLRALYQIEAAPEETEQLLPPLLHELFSRHTYPKLPAPPSAMEEGHGPAVHRAMDHMRDCLLDPPSLVTLAADAGLSKFHFLRVFKECTGFTPHAWLLHHRVRLGRQALERGSTPASAAALAGFADQSHFTRRFKAVYGLTPGVFANSL